MLTIPSGLIRRINETTNEWIGYSLLRTVLNTFPRLEVYLAGGVIRNSVLGRSVRPNDFDLFLGGEGTADALNALGQLGRMTQGPFGSPRWYPSDDSGYCDLIPISQFGNGLWTCEDIVDVLNQFDFTGNAIAIDLRTNDFYNPQNGVRHLQQRLLRAVRFDYPDEPILLGHPLSRPAVLWFRFIHYSSVLGLRLDDITRRWVEDRQEYKALRDLFAQFFFEPDVRSRYL